MRPADLGDPEDAATVVSLIDGYARGPGGGSAPLSEDALERLVPGLRAHPLATVLLALQGARRVGVAVVVEGFSTFAGRPFLNVHDLAVADDVRGQGAGTALLEEVERMARERGCSKVTLEVHDTNAGAKRLYRRMGFDGFDSPTLFLTRPL